MNSLIIIFLIASSVAATSPVLRKDDFTTWPKTDVQTFGCMMEKKLDHRDDKFNCGLKNYVAGTNPCEDGKYNEGPTFPQDEVKKISPFFDSIDLAWEHGQMQSVTVTLKKRWNEAEARKTFHLPKDASVQNCSWKHSCIILNGFDHMGAGDVDCSAAAPKNGKANINGVPSTPPATTPLTQ